jgi:magnesium and cobalt transporter
MDDSIEGSSNAARCAHDNEQGDEEQGGLFRRMLAALTPGENATTEAGDTARPAGNNAPGLGNLRDMAVEDVSTPKADIISVPLTITKDELVQVFRDSGRTRLPVYKDTLDTPVGLAHLKDFALKHGFNGNGGRFSLKKIIRPLLFVPPSMPIGVLLQKMQAERQHMALVIDEYGGVDGLVTIEDLIEQVVGEISDEHDTDEGHYWTRESPGVYLAQARAPLDEFETEIGLSLTDVDDVDEEEVDTLGGVVFMLLGRVPVRGEVVEHPVGVTIEVIEADARRIKRLKVRLPGAKD